MSFLYLTGALANVFGRTNAVVSVSPTELSVAPKAGLYDLDPSTPHIAGSVAADSYMRVQINALTNPGFETSTLSGWTSANVGTGTSTETTTAGQFRSGSKGLKLTGSDVSNYGRVYQDIVVSAGEQRQTSFYTKRVSPGAVYGYIQNLKTGNYLQTDGSWSSSRGLWATSLNVVSFSQASLAYTVESFDTCRSDKVTLRWELAWYPASGSSSGDAYADDCLDVPAVTFASIHGHNYGPVSPLVQSSDDGSAWTTRATMTIKRPAFFSTFSAIYAEYWQFKLSGTNHEAPYTGEAVLGQYTTSATSPEWKIGTSRNFPGVRTRGPSARTHVYNYSTDPPTDIDLIFSARTAAESREIAESIWLRSGQGLYPVIAVPIDTETDVYFGRCSAPVTVDRPFQGVYNTTLAIAGDPFPTVGL